MENELAQAVQQHGPAIYRIAWRILPHAEEVDDVLQDVVLESISVSRRKKIKSWVGLLKRLTVCRSLDQLRKRRPIESITKTNVPVTSRENSPVENAIGRELDSRLRDGIAELPTRQAEVFSLRYFDGGSHLAGEFHHFIPDEQTVCRVSGSEPR